MTTAAQFEWTEDRNPEAGEFTSSRKPWNAITEFTFNDLDHNGVPFDLAQVLTGERLNLAAHKGAAEYTVVSVTDRTVQVAPIYGYGDPIPGTVTTITTRAEGDFDYDDTALIARIAAEEQKRAEEDALLQQQLDGKADLDHTHDETGVADHDHDTAYAPTVHDHNQYSLLAHTHNEFNHNHDTAYAPTGHDHPHDHPHGHTEFTDLEDKDAEQDARLDALEAEAGSGYDNLYAPGDPLIKGEYSAGDKTATFHPTDSEDEGFAGVDDPWLVVCDDGPIMRIKGATADPPAPDGSITVTWTSDHQLTGTVKLGVVDPIPEHEHEEHDHPYVKSNADTDIRPTPDDRWITLRTRRPQEEDGSYADEEFGLEVSLDEGNTYKNQFAVTGKDGYALKVLGGTGKTTWIGGKIVQQGNSLENPDDRDYVTRKNLTDATDDLATKIELEELQVEVDALATTRDAGRWKVVASAAVRPGEVFFLTTSMSAADNAMTVNDTDLDGKVHGWADLEVGDFVEVVQETAGIRDVGSYGLFKITADNGGTGMRMLELTLDQGQGSLTSDSNVYIKVFHANNDLDLAELDNRYSLKSHTHDSRYAAKDHTHSYASTNHTHDYASSSHSHSIIFRNGTSSNPSLSKGEPYLNTSLKVVYVGT